MKYIGPARIISESTQTSHVYLLCDSSITTGSMTSQIQKVFEDGESGSSSTIWKITGEGRIDCQYDNNNGQNINSSLENTGSYSNYSFQSGNSTNATVFINNGLITRTEIEDAFNESQKNSPIGNKYVRLLRVLMTMMLFSNETRKKIVITQKQVENTLDLGSDLVQTLNSFKDRAKKIF